jgi:hypothetical protein
MNTHTNHKIKSHHTSLADAVAVSKIDLSYNPAEAKRTIADIDRCCRQAFVLENGDIYYVYSADIDLLHKFEPFVSCLCDTPFSVAFIVGDLLSIGQPSVPKTQAGRNWFKSRKEWQALAA